MEREDCAGVILKSVRKFGGNKEFRGKKNYPLLNLTSAARFLAFSFRIRLAQLLSHLSFLSSRREFAASSALVEVVGSSYAPILMLLTADAFPVAFKAFFKS